MCVCIVCVCYVVLCCVQHSGQFLCALMELGGRDEDGRGICWSGKRAGIKYRLSRVHPDLTAALCGVNTASAARRLRATRWTKFCRVFVSGTKCSEVYQHV